MVIDGPCDSVKLWLLELGGMELSGRRFSSFVRHRLFRSTQAGDF